MYMNATFCFFLVDTKTNSQVHVCTCVCVCVYIYIYMYMCVYKCNPLSVSIYTHIRIELSVSR